MDKRETDRRAVWVPVEVTDDEGGKLLAVSHDVSESGVRFVSPVKAEVGAHVELSLHFPDRTQRTVQGRVVRIERNPDDPDGAFPHRVAVAYEGRVAGLDEILAAVEALEAELG